MTKAEFQDTLRYIEHTIMDITVRMSKGEDFSELVYSLHRAYKRLEEAMRFDMEPTPFPLPKCKI